MYRSSSRWRLRAAGLLTCVLVVSALGAAPAGAISGGTAAEAGAFPYAAKLLIGDTARACTGALVEAQWVVTAASCFTEPGTVLRDGPPPQPTTAVIGRSLPVAELRVRADRDLVLARLALRTTGITPVAVATTPPVAGETLRVAGFGRTGSEWVPDRLHTATFTVGGSTATTIDVTGTDPERTSTCKGDAGGPALRETGGAVQLVGVSSLSYQHGCLGVTTDGRGAVEARADDLAEWIRLATRAPSTTFTASYATTAGIGTYDLKDARDQVVAFDFLSTGRQDHLLLYRPGAGIAYVVKRSGAGYVRVFSSFEGIGGFDLLRAGDRVVPYDYDGSGKLDHLIFYRPGVGTAYILRRGANNTFARVYASSDGLGTFDLKDARDQVVAFDWTGSGRRDHLILFRPGSGIAHVIKRNGAGFSRVFSSSTGIGGFDLLNARDRVVPFDYDGSGKADHLVVYRPGAGTVYIVKRGTGDTFTRVFASGTGLGNYNLGDSRDQLLAYDYGQTGRPDHLIAYRPGAGTVHILKRSGSSFAAVLSSTTGIAGFDLSIAADRIVALDDEGAGSPLQLVIHRPGWGSVFVAGRFRPAV